MTVFDGRRSGRSPLGSVHWRSISRDFKTQLKQAGLVRNHSKAILQTLRAFVMSIGFALLATRRSKDEISESAAFWWGIGIIVLLLLVILRIIPFGLLLKFGSHWLG